MGNMSGEERGVAEIVEHAMQAQGYSEVWRDELGNVVGLVGPRADKTALLFDAHMDVVPPTGNWTVAPFGGEAIDGRIFGRGAADMKGALAAAICGVGEAAASGQLTRPVAVSA